MLRRPLTVLNPLAIFAEQVGQLASATRQSLHGIGRFREFEELQKEASLLAFHLDQAWIVSGERSHGTSEINIVSLTFSDNGHVRLAEERYVVQEIGARAAFSKTGLVDRD